ncbi:DUF3307 domain-containing protein [Thalassotalea sediminis]|uniref:DUF3307 domain-containing protein n=1 Tax=Thalassotalea sediminis TaxID=1759089 RepID=UPI0025736A69|nr:DUF3307 domain-containing protein [Thalassotalea sediminis]
MDILLILLTAHFLGDFYLQPNAWVNCRNRQHFHSTGLKKHFLVHLALNTVAFSLISIAVIPAILLVLLITCSHVLIDLWKSYRPSNLTYFLVDQCLHISILIMVTIYLLDISISTVTLYIKSLLTPQNMVILITYLLACKPASIIISLALKQHTDKLSTTNNAEKKEQQLGLISAGAWIGYIERCLAISFIFIGQFAGIGFLVATKTIFRFGDLTKSQDMKLTEYMLLGTLFSYAIAFFLGWNAVEIYRWFD